MVSERLRRVRLEVWLRVFDACCAVGRVAHRASLWAIARASDATGWTDDETIDDSDGDPW